MKRTNQRQMPKRYRFENVLVDFSIAVRIVAEGYYFLFNDEHDSSYPWVLKQHSHQAVAPLHIWIYEYVHGPIPAGHVVHHRNHKKADARLQNLVLMTVSEHARLHAHERREATRDGSLDVAGMWRPISPGHVRKLSFKEEQQELRAGRISVPPPVSDSNQRRELAELEVTLRRMLPGLIQRIGPCDSGRPIPHTSRRTTKADRRELLPSELRRDTTAPEKAMVLAWIENACELGRLSLALGTTESLLRRIMSRPAVALACERWRTFGRLPAGCAPLSR